MPHPHRSAMSIRVYLKKIPFLVRLAQRVKESPINFPANLWKAQKYLRELKDLTLSHQTYLLQQNHPNPLNRFGKKCFSQADEDGITIEILRRINSIEHGTFAEFGVD